MYLNEYNSVKDLNYLEYCDYLQNKYGIGKYDYMTKSWNKNSKCTRTSEGLIAHHKYEDQAIMLSNKKYAMKNPFSWQKAKNIIFCNYLEHLYLHILICENPRPKRKSEVVGFGGAVNFIIPELNDFYSGWETSQDWRKNCHDLIRDNKETYLVLIERFKRLYSYRLFFTSKFLLTSFNQKFGGWSKKNNKELFKEIKKL